MPVIKSATTYVIEGAITDEEFAAIKAHCINPVDSRETGMEKPETLITQFEEPEDVKIFDGFNGDLSIVQIQLCMVIFGYSKVFQFEPLLFINGNIISGIEKNSNFIWGMLQ